MLTTKEAAELLGIAESTVRLWCRLGRLPGARRSGRDWIIPRRAIQRSEAPRRGRPPKEGGAR